MNIIKLFKFIIYQKSISKKLLYFLFSIFFYIFDYKKKVRAKDTFTKDDIYPLF